MSEIKKVIRKTGIVMKKASDISILDINFCIINEYSKTEGYVGLSWQQQTQCWLVRIKLNQCH